MKKKASRKLKKNKKLETAFKKSEIFIESLKATTVVKCNKSILFQNHPQRYELFILINLVFHISEDGC